MTGSAVVINDSADPANPDAYLARLPIGERPAVPTDGAPLRDIFPYEAS
ncbi:hypothetical protein ACFXPX_02385 [Kitasatospora sp. NPDC059146]